MSLVFACITAHTPLLMPTIGKDGLKVIDGTRQAMEALEQELYLAQPDTIVVISPHGDVIPDTVSINLNANYTTNLEEFGDLVTKDTWKAEMQLADKVREYFKGEGLPLVLGSPEFLDYGSAIPLIYLTKHLPNVRIMPVTSSELLMRAHYDIGKALKHEIVSSTKRVAVIASADLSHRVGDNSPGGLSPRGVAFDEKVIEIVTKPNPVGILDIDDGWVAEAQSCGAKVLAMFGGIMEDVQHEPKVLGYEKPFGVGYLVARMKIS